MCSSNPLSADDRREEQEEGMRKTFSASLCYKGAHGGGIRVDENGILYRCQKAVLPQELKRIAIRYADIKSVNRCRSLRMFPAVKIGLKDGRQYKVIIFGRERFMRCLKEVSCKRVLA